jgi:signal transduction histidine kinase/ActR/RegA family two-component response regulator
MEEKQVDLLDAQQARAASYWIPATLLALGLGSILMLIGSNWIREQLTTRDIEFVRSVGEIQTSAALAHLWVEELVSGDEVERHREEITVNLIKSEKLLNAMIDAESEKTQTTLLVETDQDTEELLQHAISSMEKLKEFSLVSHRRVTGFDRNLDVGIGSDIDIYYDSIFRDLLDDLRFMERALKDRLKQGQARSGFLFQTILIAWIALVGLAVSGIWNREWKRRQAEMALRASQAQLLQSQKMEAVGRLAGGIAHDINNHLAAITAQSELVKIKEDAAPAIRTRMDSIIATAEKSAILIKRLLAFSRRQPVVRETVEVARVVQELEPMLRGLVPEDIQLTLESDDEPWCIRIDPSQLEQVVVNLVVNAREAMPLGGRLDISTRNYAAQAGVLDDDEWVLLRVCDNGHGIELEHRNRIFEPFFTTKDAASASGLGLATIHGIVQQNNGRIEVETEVEEGTVFSVFLPRSFTSEPRRTGEPKLELPISARSETVLLVEDNTELRTSTEEILEALGFSIISAASAEEAVAVFTEVGDQVDLLITDVIMPGLDGKQLADYLRDQSPDLQVLFISGYTDDVILDRGIEQDAVNFLAKPFASRDLANKIEKILGRKIRGDGP